MPAAVRLGEDYSAEALRRLAKRSKDANQSRRLLSLAAIGDGMDRCEAARIGGMDRQSCGIGFIGSTFTARKVSLTIGWGGPKPRLSADQLAELAQMIE